MRLVDDKPLYSAKDLIAYLGCTHATALDVLALTGELAAGEEEADEYLDLLKEKGLAHERRYLETLRAEGRSIVAISDELSNDERVAKTIAAMRDGVDVIYQGTLHRAPWLGYSDFLMRVPTPSKLGAWSYEVADTKLARTAKPKHVMQLCLYSRMVEAVQGVMPARAKVVLGDGETFEFRLADYVYYTDAACERFIAFASSDERKSEAEPCGHCAYCRWAERCKEEWEKNEHLSIVARLDRNQRAKLGAAGVTTIKALAQLPETATIPGLRKALQRIRSQAQLQYVKRTTDENRVEVLPLEPRKGFARLPEPNEGDLFFDMEGDPIYSAEGGLEYLFGFHYQDGGKDQFKAFWAEDRKSEKKAFEDAMDFITARLEKYPNAYIYHYASYEEAALRRLAIQYGSMPKKHVDVISRLSSEHGTRENEVDDLLRDRKLVDLYRVVREAVRTSEPRYSLKNMEVFFAPARTQTIKAGGDSIVAFERWLLLRDPAIRSDIEEYNAFDCLSTRLCRDWLLSLRSPEVEWFDPAKEATAAEAEQEKERELERRAADAAILALRQALMDGAGDDEDEQRYRELLGFLLEYHRREVRSEWREFFKRLDAPPMHELIDSPECLGGIRIDNSVPARPEKKSRILTFTFPEQETKLKPGKVVRGDTGKGIDLFSIDESNRRLELKVGPSQLAFPEEFALIPPQPRRDTEQREAIRRYAEAVVAGNAEDYRPITSILRRQKPKLRGGRILKDGDDLLGGTVDAIKRMDHTHLVIQGPPGSGKTFTSAHAIVELLREGKRVGVTALSHKAINNLLCQVEKVAKEKGVTFRGVKKCSQEEESKLGGTLIEDCDDNNEVVSGDYQLIGGTSWLFSREELDRKLDYLFVDEAGQMSLANVVATGVSARNIVLVGDQMQLSQPTKGAHPGGSGISALDHLMGTWSTVPPDRGIFLSRTWRMHPALCSFVSDAFYDGRLKSMESMATQKLVLATDAGGVLKPTGLRFMSVEHEGCSQRSEEEAELLDGVYRKLLGQRWVNCDGKTLPITAEDILVVSPYNMQVNLLCETLPLGARVGTVDKFQGQEAAVVLISMASSSGDDIPRGIEFLFSRNRLNVAISRARCLSVIFASPSLLAVRCGRVEQIRLVNSLFWARMTGTQSQ